MLFGLKELDVVSVLMKIHSGHATMLTAEGRDEIAKQLGITEPQLMQLCESSAYRGRTAEYLKYYQEGGILEDTPEERQRFGIEPVKPTLLQKMTRSLEDLQPGETMIVPYNPIHVSRSVASVQVTCGDREFECGIHSDGGTYRLNQPDMEVVNSLFHTHYDEMVHRGFARSDGQVYWKPSDAPWKAMVPSDIHSEIDSAEMTLMSGKFGRVDWLMTRAPSDGNSAEFIYHAFECLAYPDSGSVTKARMRYSAERRDELIEHRKRMDDLWQTRQQEMQSLGFDAYLGELLRWNYTRWSITVDSDIGYMQKVYNHKRRVAWDNHQNMIENPITEKARSFQVAMHDAVRDMRRTLRMAECAVDCVCSYCETHQTYVLERSEELQQMKHEVSVEELQNRHRVQDARRAYDLSLQNTQRHYQGASERLGQLQPPPLLNPHRELMYAT